MRLIALHSVLLQPGKALWALLITFWLGGCSSTQHWVDIQKTQYQRAPAVRPLIVPAGLGAFQASSQFALPKSPVSDSAGAAESLRFGVRLLARDLFLEQDSAGPVLVIRNVPREQLWQNLQIFWRYLGFALQVDPNGGWMQTGVTTSIESILTGSKRALQKGQPLHADRFDIQLDQRQEGGIALRIIHQGLEAVRFADGRLHWRPRERDLLLEQRLFNALAQSYGVALGKR